MSAHDIPAATTVARQHGCISVAQAHHLGMSNRQIRWRLEQGLLIRVHRGVYRHAAVPRSAHTRLRGDVLACGPAAVASHRSAALLHGLRDVPCWRSEVTVAGTRLPRHGGMALHRTDHLESTDVTSVDRIPVTTLARTLLDLGAVVPFEVVEVAAQDAMIRGLVSTVELICVLERVGKRGRRGTAALRAMVRGSLPATGIESRLELDLCGSSSRARCRGLCSSTRWSSAAGTTISTPPGGSGHRHRGRWTALALHPCRVRT